MNEGPALKTDGLSEGTLLRITVLQGIILSALGAGIWLYTGRDIGDWITFGLHDILVGLATTVGLIALALLGYFFPRLSAYLISLQRETYGWLTKFNSWRVIIIISFFAGVWEEALFRGGVQVWLTDWVGAPIAIFIASAAFAAVHLSKPIIGFLQFLIGCVLGVRSRCNRSACRHCFDRCRGCHCSGA